PVEPLVVALHDGPKRERIGTSRALYKARVADQSCSTLRLHHVMFLKQLVVELSSCPPERSLLRNSCRVWGKCGNVPKYWLVPLLAPQLCMPRVVMQACVVDSATTPTTRGLSTRSITW